MEVIQLKDAVEYSNGSIVSKTILENKSGTLTLFAFDAGQNLSEHTAPFDAVVQVLDGTAELTIGGKKADVPSGGLAIMTANVPHSVRADQKFKMLLTMLKG
jgi:quercetin dioxygenase-like cupin family protein